MRVKKGFCIEAAKEIIWEFEDLLCNNDVKLNNLNPKENKFKDENLYINDKDYEKLLNEVTRQLIDFAEYVEEIYEIVA